MSDFNLRLTAKPRDVNTFKNMMTYVGTDFKTLKGKIVYMNSKYPDKHIYMLYYIDGSIAYPLSYNIKVMDKEYPIFTLDNLSPDDYIVFYTSEDKKRIEEAKLNKK